MLYPLSYERSVRVTTGHRAAAQSNVSRPEGLHANSDLGANDIANPPGREHCGVAHILIAAGLTMARRITNQEQTCTSGAGGVMLAPTDADGDFDVH